MGPFETSLSMVLFPARGLRNGVLNGFRIDCLSETATLAISAYRNAFCRDLPYSQMGTGTGGGAVFTFLAWPVPEKSRSLLSRPPARFEDVRGA